jgi:hypothetical protein
MTVECAFGISSAKFRILLKSIETSVENAVHIVKAICILHNAVIDMVEDPSIDVSKDNVTEGNNNLQLLRVNNRPSRAACRTTTAVKIKPLFQTMHAVQLGSIARVTCSIWTSSFNTTSLIVNVYRIPSIAPHAPSQWLPMATTATTAATVTSTEY